MPPSERKPGQVWVTTDTYDGLDRRKKPREPVAAPRTFRMTRLRVILAIAFLSFLILLSDIDSQHDSCLRSNDLRDAYRQYLTDQEAGLVMRNQLPDLSAKESALNAFRAEQVNSNRTLLTALSCGGIRPATQGSTGDNIPEPTVPPILKPTPTATP